MKLVYCYLALSVFVAGCSLLQPCPVDEPAARFAEDWREARSETSPGGTAIDQAEVHMLDRDAGFLEIALEEKSKPFQMPTTGIPWVDGIIGLVGVGTAIAGAHKTVNWSRDRKRKQRGEAVGTERVA